jgi:S1-C subfamily serine protease
MLVMDQTQAIDLIRPAIVQIVVLSNAAERVPIGTGFFVNQDGYVVTADHVLRGGAQIAHKRGFPHFQFALGLALENSETVGAVFTLTYADIVGRNPRQDLAILRLRRNAFKGEMRSGFVVSKPEVPLPLGEVEFDPRRPRDGTAVAASGFPFDEPVLVTKIGAAWDMEKRVSPDLTWSAGATTSHYGDAFISDLAADPGNSGVPVYLIDGAAVVGVCVAGRGERGTHLTIIVPARTVIDLLKKHGVAWKER